MFVAKNISSKVIGIPVEGGVATLFPEASANVDDSLLEQMENLEKIGLIRIGKVEEPVDQTDVKKVRNRAK